MLSSARIVNALGALLFLVGAAVQYNDPDPLVWMAIYLAAAAACVLAVVGKLRWWFAAAVALVALVWAGTLAPRAFPNVAISELFASWQMKNTRVEEGREMYALLLIFAWMAVLAFASRTPRRPGA